MVAISLKLLSEMESAFVQSNEHASTIGSNANSSSTRAKCDPAWDHIIEELKDGKSSYRCIYCGKIYKGGGINRMKRHLAGIKGDVAACTVEDEEPPFLNHEEIENKLYEEGTYPIEERSSSHVQRDMDKEVIEDDDDINLESFGDELDAPPEFRDKNHRVQVEDEEDENEDDDNDASGGAFGSHDDIDFNFLHNE
nr:hypothetical protein CFP56_76113 [Quercus suber]